MAMLFGTGYSFGIFLLSYPFAYCLRNWRKLQFYLGISSLPFIALSFLVQVESWKWLVMKNRVDDAVDAASRLSRRNSSWAGTKPDFEQIGKQINQLALATQTSAVEKTALLDILKKFIRYPLILKQTALLSVIKLVNVAVYFYFSLDLSAIQHNDFLANAVLALAEIPGLLLMTYLNEIRFIGRKRFQVSFLCLAGVLCLLTEILLQQTDRSSNNLQSGSQEENSVDQTYQTFAQVFKYVGKMIISGSYNGINLWMSEIYSTDVRSTGYSMVTMISRIGGIVCPFVINLGSVKAY